MAGYIDKFEGLWVIRDLCEGAGSGKRPVVCDLLIFPELTQDINRITSK